MKDRLTRFVNERTHMLAALSHDLRSPLTAMRLRIEMLDETEDSIRLKALVEEMQAMVEATLEFARGVARAEPAIEVDLAVLLGDLVGDVGRDSATLAPSQPLLATIRPQALNRALRNLIDNAVRYGGVAKVTLKQETGVAVVTIADEGPGLPDDQLEAVFEPFVRLEGSRSRDTGGVGLGLAIARTTRPPLPVPGSSRTRPLPYVGANPKPFIKAASYRQLADRINRSAKAIEYKHQNISAVLKALGETLLTGLALLSIFRGRSSMPDHFSLEHFPINPARSLSL